MTPRQVVRSSTLLRGPLGLGRERAGRTGRGCARRGKSGGRMLALRASQRCGSSRPSCRSGACGGGWFRRSRQRRSPGWSCTTCREASGAVREVSPRSTRREENARGSPGRPLPALPTRRASFARSRGSPSFPPPSGYGLSGDLYCTIGRLLSCAHFANTWTKTPRRLCRLRR